MNFLNIAAYAFKILSMEQLLSWQIACREKACQENVKGTILLSTEGINLFLSGEAEQIRCYQLFLTQLPGMPLLHFRETWSHLQPFKRLKVKIKKEIISFGQADIFPTEKTAPYVQPETLRSWYEQGKTMTLLDARNNYEVEMGTFMHAIDLKIKHFRHFPRAANNLPVSMREQPLVTFCTGGIRCEKAALWLQTQGFKEVYQLQGGILNYFAKCNGAYYQGKCFVFDERNALES